MSVETAKRYPVRTALSGPAAGVIAATEIAKAAGFDDIITCDMGGTSFDVSLVAGNKAALAAQTAIDFGMVVRTPMIEITTIGAGGGSIASVDRGGLLQVGPESAGSDPGPVCYGLGSERPTVTDANLVLGRINPDRPIGGKLSRLDVEAARRAIASHIAEPLGISIEDAAEAVLRLANAKMAGAIRLVSIEKGHDPSRFAAMPFGGGGSLHTGALIKEVGLGSALVPRFPGVTSALGCVMADMRHDAVQTLNVALADVAWPELLQRLDTLAKACQVRLDSAGVHFVRVDEVISFDMLYMGQTHTLQVPVKREALIAAGLLAAFEAAYHHAFGRVLQGPVIRVMNLRYARIGRRPKFDLAVLAPQGEGRTTPVGEQQVYHQGQWWTAQRYERLSLPVGTVVQGPAILEQPDTTVWLEPGFEGRVDTLGNLLVERTA